MARGVKCKCCGKALQPEEKHKYDNRYYCEECFHKVEKDAREYKQLMDYIFTIFHLEKANGLILNQVKKFRKEYNYPYAAMTYTLWYCKEILGKSFNEKYGIYIIEHYYDEACNFYLQQEKQKEQADKISKADIKTKIVNRKSLNMNKIKSSTSLINLGDLIEGGDSN